MAGCYYHAHEECETGRTSPLLQARDRDREREAFFREHDIDVVIQWECEFDQEIKANPHLKEEIQSFYPTFYRENPGGVTMAQILDAVRRGAFFGTVLCSLEVDPAMRSYYDEFPPLYGKAEITYADIGPHMQDFYKQHNIKYQKRKNLVMCFDVQNILLTSELLAYYMTRGVTVVHIEEVTESVKGQPFKSFVDSIVQMRRQADSNSDLAVKANLAKLIG